MKSNHELKMAQHMEIKELQHVEVIKDVLCDVWGKSTQMNYGELKAESGIWFNV